jgi:SulP family sulfate permease
MTGESTAARRDFQGDAWGGLAAMLVALPSAIAFGVTIFAPLDGSLAAKGALAGILGATVLGLVAPACGGSVRLITAPCAPAAAMLSASAIGFAQQGVAAETVLLLLALIGLLAGGFQVVLGLAGVGRLIKFIPYPVVSGYLSGVGLIIIGSQIPKFLGVPAGTGLWQALVHPSAWSGPSIAVGVTVVAAMLLTPRFIHTVPPAIVALLAGIAVYLGMGLFHPELLNAHQNPLVIGSIAAGEGGLAGVVESHWRAVAGLGADSVVRVLVPALTLAALLSIDTLKTCVVLDAMTGSHTDSNRELVGQGVANLACALVGGIPGAGTMGASLINLSSGGHTRASGLMAGFCCFAAYLLLSPVIAWVPVAALAAILIVIGARMIDRHSLVFFFSPATRLDFLVILSVIVVALFGNLIAASGVGVALAILLFIREHTRSSVVRSRVEGHDIFSKRARAPEEVARLEHEGGDCVVFELQGSLFFGTASQLQAALEPEIGRRRYVILGMRRVQSLDLTATHVLEQIKERLEHNGAYLVFCDIPKGLPSGLKMKRFLKETGVVRRAEHALTFHTLDEALEWVEARELERTSADPHGEAMDLHAMPLFAGQSEAALAALEQAMTLRTVKAGKKLFKAGSPGDELFVIRRGTVKVTLPIRKKEGYHLATSGPGEIVGGIGFLDAREHAADAVAVTEVEAYVLPRARFEDLAAAHRGLALGIIEGVTLNLASRLRATVGELQALRG